MSAPQPSLQLDAALQARDRGWRPFPLDHPELPECAGIPHGHHCEPKDRGKHPCVAFGTACHVEPGDALLRHWWSQGPRNVGVAAGPSGLVVVDEDEPDALERFAHQQREKLPKTYRVMTSRGWHWYFGAPEDLVIGNSPGLLGPHGMDVRGGKGGGGYVVGAGSVHHTGHVYVAEDPFIVPAALPDWLATAILTKPARTELVGPGARTGSMSASPLGNGGIRSDTGAWTDDPRYGTTDALRAQYYRHLGEVMGRGDQFRHSLYLAALDGWRLVDIGLYTDAGLYADLRGRIREVWGAPPDDRDRQIVNVEARTKASESPWVVLDAPASPLVTQGVNAGSEVAVRHDEQAIDVVEASVVPAPPTAEQVHELQVQAEVNRLALQREARDRLAAANREPLRRLSFAEFLDQPAPDYLIPRMLYRDGLAVVFGAPGAAKSFLMLDIGLTVATGRAWRGKPVKRGRVHYVMAEGQATNMLRTRAWLQRHDVDVATPDGWFDAFPQAVLLTEAGVVDYIAAVEEDQPDLIILDTKNLMFGGKESQGEDYGAMLRVLHKLRAAAGGCCIVLIDHSGLGDDSRVRGSNAQKGGLDTEVCVTELRDGVREAKVTRDKSGVVGTTWLFGLEQVDVVPRPLDVDPPAVCVPVEAASLRELTAELRESHWDAARDWLPEVVAAMGGRAGDAACDVFRMLVQTKDTEGLTVSQMATNLADCPRQHSRTNVYNAVNTLVAAGVLEAGTTSKSRRLAAPYRGWNGRPSDL